MSTISVLDTCTADTWCCLCDEHSCKQELRFGGLGIGQTTRELLLSAWLYEKVRLSKAESLLAKQKPVKLECGLVLLQPTETSVRPTLNKGNSIAVFKKQFLSSDIAEYLIYKNIYRNSSGGTELQSSLKLEQLKL